jgi:hypothetical protein
MPGSFVNGKHGVMCDLTTSSYDRRDDYCFRIFEIVKLEELQQTIMNGVPI